MAIPDYIIEIAPGADLSAAPGTWTWLDITGDVRTRSIGMSRGRPDEGRRSDPSSMKLVLSNRDGRYSTRNPESDLFGLIRRNTPIRFRVESNVLFAGFVQEWPPRWDRSGNHAWVPLGANGILRRLDQGIRIARSAMEAAVSSHATFAAFGAIEPALKAYWPMESIRITSATGAIFDHHPDPVFGAAPADMVAVAPASEGFRGLRSIEILGSANLTTFPPNVSATATYDLAPFEDTFWRLDFIVQFGEETTAETNIMDIRTDGTVDEFVVTLDETATLRVTDGVAGNLDFTLAPTFDLFETALLISVTVDTPTNEVTLIVSRALREGTIETESASAIAAASVGDITRHTIPPVLLTTIEREIPATYGHVAISQGQPVAGGLGIFYPARTLETDLDPWVNLNLSVFNGWSGEPAALRMFRLTDDDGLPFELVDNPGADLVDAEGTRLMGPEPAGTILSKLTECPDTDSGLLFEREFGFGYRRRSDQIDLPPVFELGQGSLTQAPEPTDDDQRIRNFVRCEARDGGVKVVRNDVSIDNEGLYDRGVATRNVHQVTELQDIASDLIREGTVDELRWPSLSITLAGRDSLIDGRLNLVEGSVIRLAHEWDQLPTVTPTDLIVQGWTDTISQRSQWLVELNCVPASPWQTPEDEDGMTVIAFDENTTVTTTDDTTVTGITLADVAFDADFFYRIEAQCAVAYDSEADQDATDDMAEISIVVDGFSPSLVGRSGGRPHSVYVVGTPIGERVIRAVTPVIAPPSTGPFDVRMTVRVVTSPSPGVNVQFGGSGTSAQRLTVYRVGSSLS